MGGSVRRRRIGLSACRRQLDRHSQDEANFGDLSGGRNKDFLFRLCAGCYAVRFAIIWEQWGGWNRVRVQSLDRDSRDARRRDNRRDHHAGWRQLVPMLYLVRNGG